MPEGLNNNERRRADSEIEVDKFCIIHDRVFTGRSCPQCDAENNKDNNPDTSHHPADCECDRCRRNKWFDNNTPL